MEVSLGPCPACGEELRVDEDRFRHGRDLVCPHCAIQLALAPDLRHTVDSARPHRVIRQPESPVGRADPQ
jgi:hydrogenase maturation factor HypF (carbamoyltransferase family)